MTQHIIITGNPVDGFAHIGPFQNHDLASFHAEQWVRDEWWIAQLEESREDE